MQIELFLTENLGDLSAGAVQLISMVAWRVRWERMTTCSPTVPQVA